MNDCKNINSSVVSPFAIEKEAGGDLLSIREARRRAGAIGVTKAYELIRQGKWRAVKIGARTFITSTSFTDFLASLPVAKIGAGRGVGRRSRQRACSEEAKPTVDVAKL